MDCAHSGPKVIEWANPIAAMLRSSQSPSFVLPASPFSFRSSRPIPTHQSTLASLRTPRPSLSQNSIPLVRSGRSAAAAAAKAKRERQREKLCRREVGGERPVKMSGNGVKKVAEVAAKAGKSIDWDGMAKMLVSDEARKEFYTLRRAFDDVNHQLQTKFSQEPQPIDWEYYRKGIGSKVVDMYKKAYESVEIPKFVDTVTPEYKTKFEALVVELKQAEKESLKESERIEKEIADLQEMKKRISTMTADEYFEKHPEVKQKFDDEIRNDYWGY